MKNIFITCDFLTTRIITQEYHLKWFWIIINRALEYVHGNKIKFDEFNQLKKSFSRKQFFEKSQIKIQDSETHSYFNPTLISEDSIEYLKRLFKDSLIIGYELSEETKLILNKSGIIYIDVWLHPIRFMDDNFYAYDSNNINIRKKLFDYKISEKEFFLYADKLKIQSFMGFNKFIKSIDTNLEENSCLIIGQTLTDKSVCKRGKMLTILDFKNEILNLAKKYSHIYYSPHPMLKGDISDQFDFINKINNASVISEPAYFLLCSEKIKEVVAISSSIVYEAKFFGKETKYLYKPSVVIAENFTEDGFVSIFNKLHSPRFWSELLTGLFDIDNNVVDVDYLGAKNNYRDMLSLFYNNYTFDKEQYYIAKFNTHCQHEIKPIHETNKEKKPDRYYLSNKINVERISNKINQVDVVSFDLFDTLLQRKVDKPSAVINIVSNIISSKTKIDCRKIIESRKNAKLFYGERQEVSLLERYTRVKDELKLNLFSPSELANLEEEIDTACLELRAVGVELLKEAKLKNKKVILISDTFYSKDFIIHILNELGIRKYIDKVYLSSEFNKTKNSGDLFKFVKEKEKGKILHIGDNYNSDVIKSRENGIEAIYLPSNIDQIKIIFDQYKPLTGYFSYIKNGLIVNNMAAYPIKAKKPGYVADSSYNFGYNVVGDIFLNFALWIKNKAKSEKINHLVFLARDGEIIKKVFDKINTEKIKTTYLLASRRSVRVCSIYNRDDVIREIDDFFDNLKTLTPSSYKKACFRLGLTISDINEKLVATENKIEKLKSYFLQTNILDKVICNAKKEREEYLNYLTQNNINDNVGFVDIGHNGSLQKGIANLLGLKKTRGFYFATYKNIESNLKDVKGDHKGFGFVRNAFDTNIKGDLYLRYALIIETLFLNRQGSFVKIEREKSKLVYRFLPTKNESKRISFITGLDSGILKFVDDVVQISKKLRVDLIKWDSAEICCNRLFNIFKNPSPFDASIFLDVNIENNFGGRENRFIVAKAKSEYSNTIWKEGSKVLIGNINEKKVENTLNKNSNFVKITSKNLLKLIGMIYVLVCGKSNSKSRKLILNPEKFYQDTKNKFIKTLWKLSK